MSVKFRTVLTGLASNVPGVMPLYRRFGFRPNAAPAEVCYGIWLKHFVQASDGGMGAVPAVVAELGPGLSLGFGLAALICGARRYLALDVLPFARNERLLSDFDQLVSLFRERRRPGNADGFPSYADALDENGFPKALPKDEAWSKLMSTDRLDALRADLAAFVNGDTAACRHLSYIAPWSVKTLDQALGQVDLLCSHTVLQHVGSVPAIWADIASILRPGGWSTHQINFDSHGTASLWSGHWGASETLWAMALGRKEFLINREPLSAHLAALRGAGLELAGLKKMKDLGGIRRDGLAPRWQAMSDEDLTTRGTFVLTRRPAAQS